MNNIEAYLDRLIESKVDAAIERKLASVNVAAVLQQQLAAADSSPTESVTVTETKPASGRKRAGRKASKKAPIPMPTKVGKSLGTFGSAEALRKSLGLTNRKVGQWAVLKSEALESQGKDSVFDYFVVETESGDLIWKGFPR